MTEVCASDLLLLTQGRPGSQSSLNYSAVPVQKELSSTNQTGRTLQELAALFQSQRRSCSFNTEIIDMGLVARYSKILAATSLHTPKKN